MSTLPVFRNAGAKSAGTTSEVSVGAPTGLATGDLEILIAECAAANTVSISTAGGGSWTLLSGLPVSVTGGEKLYVWWRIRAGGDSDPGVTASADHVCACRLAYQTGTFDTTTPIDAIVTGTETTSDTSYSFAPGNNTSIPNCLVLSVSTILRDSNVASVPVCTNASLSSLNSRANHCTNSGNGGGYGVTEGARAAVGSTGTWACTYAAASAKSYVSFAIRPARMLGSSAIALTLSVASVGTALWTLSSGFETGTSGDTIVTGDTGNPDAWDAVDGPGTTGTRQYDNTYAAHGSLSGKFGCTATDPNINLYWNEDHGADVYGRMYLYLTANPGGNVSIYQCVNSSFTHQWGVRLRSDGKVALLDTSFVEQVVTTNALTLDQWNRLEWHVTQAGAMELKIFAGDSTSAIETPSSTGESTGSGWAKSKFGVNYAGTFTAWIDDPSASTEGWIGPAASTPTTRYGSAAIPLSLNVTQSKGTVKARGSSVVPLTFNVPLRTPIRDNFNRSNGALTNAEGFWYGTPATLGVVSNVCTATPATGTVYTDSSYAADQEWYFTFASWNSSAETYMWARLVARDYINGYQLKVTTLGQVILLKFVAGSPTTLSGSGLGVIADGDTLLFRLIGKRLEAWRRRAGAWTLLVETTDTTYTSSGYAGISLFNSTTIDDFGGGSLLEFPTCAVIDTFNRANEGPPPTGWSNWWTGAGNGFIVTSNQLGVQNSGAGESTAYWTTAMAGPDVDAYVEIPTLPVSGGAALIQLRLDPAASGGAGTGYLFWWEYNSGGDDSWQILTLNGVAGAFASTSSGYNLAAGDALGARCIGNRMELWARLSGVWTKVLEGTNSEFAGTGSNNKVGIYHNHNSSTVARFDNYQAGLIPRGVLRGRINARGASAIPFTLSFASTGSRQILGSAAVAFTFTVASVGTRIALGTSAAQFAYTFSVLGRVQAFAAASIPLAWSAPEGVITTDVVSLGLTNATVTNSTTATLATSSAAAAGSLIVVFISWYNQTGVRTLSSVSDSVGLTWQIDHTQNKERVGGAIASAVAPAGLASGTTITFTMSASTNELQTRGAISLLGADTSAAREDGTSAESSSAGGASWTTPSFTAAAGSIVFGLCIGAGNGDRTSTPTSPWIESHDQVWDAGQAGCTLVYQIVQSGGSYQPGGTWSNGLNDDTQAITLGYKVAAGGVRGRVNARGSGAIALLASVASLGRLNARGSGAIAFLASVASLGIRKVLGSLALAFAFSAAKAVITLDVANVGRSLDLVDRSSYTLTTSSTAASGSVVVVTIHGYDNVGGGTLSSVTDNGPGLTWTVHESANLSGIKSGVASAYAPSGLPSGTVITFNLGATLLYAVMMASSFLNVDRLGSREDGTSASEV